jgi:hypothetical protein
VARLPDNSVCNVTNSTGKNSTKNTPGRKSSFPGKRLSGYDSVVTAYEEAKKIMPPGSFLMKSIPVNPEDEIIALSPFVYG